MVTPLPFRQCTWRRFDTLFHRSVDRILSGWGMQHLCARHRVSYRLCGDDQRIPRLFEICRK